MDDLEMGWQIKEGKCKGIMGWRRKQAMSMQEKANLGVVIMITALGIAVLIILLGGWSIA